MAVIRLISDTFGGVDMSEDFDNLAGGDIVDGTRRRFEMGQTDLPNPTAFGEDITYRRGPFGQILEVTGGTIRGFDVFQSFGPLMEIRKVSYDASDFAELINDGDAVALRDHVLRGNDKVVGSVGGDVVTGGRGNDKLDGGDGFDSVSGGDGRDVVNGGRGGDLLNGGAGRDKFVLNTKVTGSFGWDVIEDFTGGQDQVRLDDAIFKALREPGELDPDRFVVGPDATTTAHRVVYDSVNGAVWYDKDGSGEADAIRIFDLAIGTVFGADDVFVF
jgi:Ca2+-binding RTX toxin-like protein